MSEGVGVPESNLIVETLSEERLVKRGERYLELAAVFVLAFATLVAAWSGYQAVRWDGKEAGLFAQSAADDADAVKASILANQQVLYDATTFIEWLNAHAAGNTTLAATYEARFRPEFTTAFDAWLALDPFNNPAAPAGPAMMPDYEVAEAAQADSLSEAADHAIEEGEHARENADSFVLYTVFLASALFLAGISSRFDWRSARIVVLVLAGVVLVYAAWSVVQLPVA
jgi:hypothetical protein